MAKKSKFIANLVEKPKDNRSIVQKISSLPDGIREEALAQVVDKYCDGDYEKFRYTWDIWRRPDQWFDIIPDPNWRTAAWLCGRGFGKHLAQDTDIFTLNRGWLKWRDLKVGDVLFTETGETTNVTHVHPTIIPKKCYRLHFSDGTTIDASDTHRWATWTAKDRETYYRTRDVEHGKYPKNWVRWSKSPHQGQIITKELFNQIQKLKNEGNSRYKVQKILQLSPWKTVHKYYAMDEYPKFSVFNTVPDGRVKTTQELADTITTKRGRLNHTIPQCVPLIFEEKVLPIHPFLLGLFLGDGSRDSGSIAGDLRDLAEYKDYFDKLGYISKITPLKKTYDSNFHTNNECGNLVVKGMYGDIRRCGLHGNKHIPEQYLYGSIQQRKDLLAGLMATDGSYSSDGSQAYFYNTDKNLIDGVYWLVTSLGMHGVISKNDNFCRGKQVKDLWRVRFSPTYPVFNLARKDAKIRFNTKTFIERYHRTIVKIEEIEPVPMNCITVDSPNETYLVTKSLVCSLNTRTAAEIARHLAETNTAKRIGVICPTAHDANAVFLNGEAIDIETDIPTPSGWKKMKDIHAGDYVFDENGNPVRVLWESPVHYNRDCYELVFDDNSKIIADAEHKWKVESYVSRVYKRRGLSKVKHRDIYSTLELKENLVWREYPYKTILNFHIPVVSKPVEFSRTDQPLPIHPYLLGYHLGDGTRGDSQITTMDQDVVNRIYDLGYDIYLPEWCKKGKRWQGKAQTYTIKGLKVKLRDLGLYEKGNKFIPEQYLFSSVEDRLELLRGLLDSDGTISKNGKVSFSNTELSLIRDFCSLVASLGAKYTVVKRRRKKESYKECYEVGLYLDFELFHIKRKLERQKKMADTRVNSRLLREVNRVQSVPVKCIAVESETNLYLCSNNYITTHNSGLMNISPSWFKPIHHPTYKNVTWKDRDTVLYLFALDLATEVPTPEGFKKIEDIHVGDKVFDENGNPCDVVYETPVMLGNKCYELTFKNGQKVVCDKDHLWRVSTIRDRSLHYHKGYDYIFRTLSTEEIAANFTYKHTGKGEYFNNWIRLTKPVNYDDKNLPIPSYLLGIWLGDGDSNSGSIATADPEIIDIIKEYGYTVGHNDKYPINWHVHGLITQLKSINLHRNKHIPEIYMRGSINQRLGLLQGLLDSDGSATKAGEIVFSNTNEKLVDGVVELVASLGGWTTKRLCSPKKNNPHKSELPIWKVSIRKIDKPFKLKRKQDRVTARRRYRDIPIVEIREVESRPVKCIRVNSESNLFLVTRTYLPTHNSAEDPESLRGHQFDWLIMDELAAWSKGKAVWEQAIFVNRLGKHPRAIVTTTPKANDLIKAVVSNPDTWTICGSTLENSDNIDTRQMMNMFEGTRLGRQELYGEILEDVEGALWSQKLIDETRILPRDSHKIPDFAYIVIAVDPAMTTNKRSDETGICVAAYGIDDHYYVLYADSHKDTASEWANRVLALYDEFMCGSIVVEKNQGGDMVLENLQKARPNIAVYGVHTKKGKYLRAEPIQHLYELKKVHHVGSFPKAEDQMTQFNPIKNPDGDDDCVDSLVYSLSALAERAMVDEVYAPAVGGIRSKLTNFKLR